MKEIKINSKKRNEMIDITNDIQQIVYEEKVKDGYVIVYVPHTTAGITINEGADLNVQRDIIKKLRTLIPENDNYSHIEGNSDAHIKASLLGASVLVLINNNKLVLGTWQHIFFFEGDGPRTRKAILNFFNKND